jgi:hypothetical protein
MSLISPVRIEAASKYLHELDVNSILRAIGSHKRDEIHQNGNTLRNQASLSTRSPGTFPIPTVSPMRVTISSLVLPNNNRDPALRTLWLNAVCQDSSSRIHRFAETLQQCFTAAGFLAANQRPLNLQLRIIDMRVLKTQKTNNAWWIRKAIGKDVKHSPLLDAQDLIERYKEYEWAKDIRLEKLSISETGRKHVLENGKEVDWTYREVASTPLP